MNARVEAICISDRRGEVKRPVAEVALRRDHGIVGDAHAGPGGRQVSLLAAESIAAVRAQIPELAPGAFAENLITRGLDLAAVAVGTILRVGAARLEVSQIGKECHQGCAIQQITGDCIMPREGIFCRVLDGGVLRTGDAVAVETPGGPLALRRVPVREAVGLALAHDITEIRAERGLKHRAFRRGQVITDADIERLLDLGKATVHVQVAGGTGVHEDDAAMTVAPAVAGPGVSHDPEPSEGKVAFRAEWAGVLRIDTARLLAINSLEAPALPTLPANYPVVAGQTVAAFRIIPLACEQAELDAVMAQLQRPLLHVDPYLLRTAAVLVTGTEVFEGRIEDGFVARLSDTLAAYEVPVTESAIVPDDRAVIRAEIERMAGACDLVLVTGGTSVDPDDVTVQAMADAGVEIVVRGVPVQPGNHFTVGYRGAVPVCAVPAGTLFHRATSCDLLLPRILAGERLDRRAIANLGLGGLAQPGTDDHFPNTTFGAGGWL